MNGQRQHDATGRFIGIPDDIFRTTLQDGPVWAVVRVVIYEQQRRHRSPGRNIPVPISGKRFQELTAMSLRTTWRAVEKARDQELIEVEKGGGHGKPSTYALSEKLCHQRHSSEAGNSVTGDIRTVTPVTPHRKSDSGEPSVAPSPLSEESEEATPLRLGLDLLALGVAVQIVKPSGSVIECRPDDHGPLLRMLGSDNPDLAIAALISDRPSPGVLSGREQLRMIARLQRTTLRTPDEWPLTKVLPLLDRPVRKGPRWQARCPLCGRPEVLEVKERRDGKVNVKCYRGCDTEQLLAVIGLTMRDLYPQATTRGLVTVA